MKLIDAKKVYQKILWDCPFKMVLGLKRETYEEKCMELGLDTLKERRAQQDLMLAHKLVGGSIKGGEHLLRKTDRLDKIRTHQAADPNSLGAQYVRMDTRKSSFGVRIVEPWNKLALDKLHCIEKGKFKAKIKA